MSMTCGATLAGIFVALQLVLCAEGMHLQQLYGALRRVHSAISTTETGD